MQIESYFQQIRDAVDHCDTVIIRPRPNRFTAILRGLHQQVWAAVDVDEWLNQERSAWA